MVYIVRLKLQLCVTSLGSTLQYGFGFDSYGLELQLDAVEEAEGLQLQLQQSSRTEERHTVCMEND